jgi:hypothetical protein
VSPRNWIVHRSEYEANLTSTHIPLLSDLGVVTQKAFFRPPTPLATPANSSSSSGCRKGQGCLPSSYLCILFSCWEADKVAIWSLCWYPLQKSNKPKGNSYYRLSCQQSQIQVFFSTKFVAERNQVSGSAAHTPEYLGLQPHLADPLLVIVFFSGTGV